MAQVSPVLTGGTVDFQDGGRVISGCGSQPVNTPAGKATCQVAYSGAGSHSITAAHGGDDQFEGSTSDTPSRAVNKASTTTHLTSSASPSVATRP